VLKLLGRDWNLGGSGNDQEVHRGGVALTVDDLFEAAGDAAAMHDDEEDDDDAVPDDDGMFEKIDIHNMDPHAISDEKIEKERAGVAKAAAAASVAAAEATAAGLVPEAVKQRASSGAGVHGGNASTAVSRPVAGVGNPEELDIGDDWDDGG
jgi:hypothetical protein